MWPAVRVTTLTKTAREAKSKPHWVLSSNDSNYSRHLSL